MQTLDRISGYAHVALRYGMEEAIFLDSIVFWYKENKANDRNFQDGRWWTFNTVSAFEKLFPWWSAKQIRRIITSCREQGALLSGCYNEDRRDRTLWYSPSDALLALYGMAEEAEPDGETGNCICPDGQTSADQTGKCNKEHVITHVFPPISPQGEEQPEETEEPEENPPDLFDAFWSAYPRKRGKEKARRAWKKLKPDIALCRTMSAALERDKASRDWQKDAGAYIPYPATWLNGRRWEDEPSQPPPDERPMRPEGGRWL